MKPWYSFDFFQTCTPRLQTNAFIPVFEYISNRRFCGNSYYSRKERFSTVTILFWRSVFPAVGNIDYHFAAPVSSIRLRSYYGIPQTGTNSGKIKKIGIEWMIYLHGVIIIYKIVLVEYRLSSKWLSQYQVHPAKIWSSKDFLLLTLSSVLDSLWKDFPTAKMARRLLLLKIDCNCHNTLDTSDKITTNFSSGAKSRSETSKELLVYALSVAAGHIRS